MSSTEFQIKWNPDYTIRRSLKKYTGEHPRVTHWKAPLLLSGQPALRLVTFDDERKPIEQQSQASIEAEYSADNLRHMIAQLGGRYGKKDEKGKLAKALYKLVQRLQHPQWHQSCRELINAANEAIQRLAGGGYSSSTLRQLYYQIVARNLIPNHQTVYDVLGEVLTNARYKGLIDWNAIEDRNRGTYAARYEYSVKDALESAASRFRLDRQEGQETEIMVMAEKDAVSNIVTRSCARYTARFTIMKGYGSASVFHSMYSSLKYDTSRLRPVVILYLGDHDPSGLDMVRDVQTRLCHMLCTGGYVDLRELYQRAGDGIDEYDSYVDQLYLPELEREVYTVRGFSEPQGGKVQERSVYFEFWSEAVAAAYVYYHLLRVIPIALTMEQIKQWELPPNPAKIQDSRAAAYIAEYGNESWELDAIPHAELERLIQSNIEAHMDMDQYAKVLAREKEDRARILSIVSDDDDNESEE